MEGAKSHGAGAAAQTPFPPYREIPLPPHHHQCTPFHTDRERARLRLGDMQAKAREAANEIFQL